MAHPRASMKVMTGALHKKQQLPLIPQGVLRLIERCSDYQSSNRATCFHAQTLHTVSRHGLICSLLYLQ